MGGRARRGEGLVVALVCLAVATAVGRGLPGQQRLADVVMVYLLGVVIVSMRYGYVESLASAVASVLCFDFFFVPPHYTFAVDDPGHLVTFAVMLVVAIVISSLTRRVRDHAEGARVRERAVRQLYELKRDLDAAQSCDAVVLIASRHLRPFGEVSITLDAAATNTSAAGVPLVASRGVVGELSIVGDESIEHDREQVVALAQLVAAAIEREQLAQESHDARLRVETEQIRNALLSSISHDLRTPLAVVTGAASTLLDDRIPPAVRTELTETIMKEAQSLERRLENLLDMTRLEGGALEVKRQWQPLEEVIGTALRRTETALAAREVTVSLPDELSLVPIDATLIEQVLVNLLENASKYTPEATPIRIAAARVADAVQVEIEDRGAGVDVAEAGRIFEKFQRGRQDVAGAGLGLAICRGIVAAHGGQIWVVEREGGGASFRFTIPIVGEAPALEGGVAMSTP